MANGKVHKVVGTAAGASAALYRARRRPLLDQLIEGAGGALGGYLGGQLPDVLEPAIHSWHRDLCHSWSASGAISAGLAKFSGWERACREKAAWYRNIRLASGAEPGKAFLHALAELFWNFVAGLFAGVAAGYLSHLALDAQTPRGLPLLGT